jgi:uncharacterized protein YycO
VIFTNNHGGFFSKLIRFRGRLEGEKPKCSHTELYTSNGRAISANQSGVEIHDISKYFNGGFDFYLYKRKNMSTEERNLVIVEATRWIGRPYDWLGIVWQGLDAITFSTFFSRAFNKGLLTYCSELVQRAYKNGIGMLICDKPIGSATPFNIMECVMDDEEWECVFALWKDKNGKWWVQP